MEEYESDEESELRFECELERLENECSYIQASLEIFCLKPEDILAKKLWLKYTLLNEAMPENVKQRMVPIIKKQVDDYQINHPSSREINEWNNYRLFDLLDIAKNEPDRFWKILHDPKTDNSLMFLGFDEDMLEKLRNWLPERKKFKPKELNSIFESLEKGDEHPPKPGTFDGEDFRKRYRRSLGNKYPWR